MKKLFDCMYEFNLSLMEEWYAGCCDLGHFVNFIIMNAGYQQGFFKSIHDLEEGNYYRYIGHALNWSPPWARKTASLRNPIQLTPDMTFKVMKVYGLKPIGPRYSVDIKLNGTIHTISDDKHDVGYLFQEA